MYKQYWRVFVPWRCSNQVPTDRNRSLYFCANNTIRFQYSSNTLFFLWYIVSSNQSVLFWLISVPVKSALVLSQLPNFCGYFFNFQFCFWRLVVLYLIFFKVIIISNRSKYLWGSNDTSWIKRTLIFPRHLISLISLISYTHTLFYLSTV